MKNDFVKKIKQLRINILIVFYSLIPLKKNKIIFWSNAFKSYGCNPKYMTEYLLNKYGMKFDIVWVFDASLPKFENLPKEIRTVKYFSKEYLYELHTAKFVVCNSRTSDSYMWHKRKKQVYIQTWHSSIRLKTIEKDAENFLPQSYIDAAINDSKKIDYIISGCNFSTEIFKNSFWYNGKILECGTPRIDYLINQSKTADLYKKTNLSDEYHYILYAPTFRMSDDFSYNLDFEKIVCTFEHKFGGKWKVLYRLHPNLIFKIRDYDLDNNCIDMSLYSDMQELIALSDAMITDYSSCMFDMMYIKKPCFLYMPDYEDYINSERKLYFKIDDLPFVKSFDKVSLLKSIDNFNAEDYAIKSDKFLKQIGSYEFGDANSKIADIIFK